jgi:hypothetical protein
MRAADLDAAIALGALPFCANERTYPILLAPDRIERIEAGELDVEFGVGIPVEQFERLLELSSHLPSTLPKLQPTRFK